MKKIPGFLLLLALPSFAAAPSSEMMSVAARQANVRSGPGAGHEVVWRAVRFYPLEVLDREGAWVRVSDYEKDEGWVHGSVLTKTPAVVVVARKANIREGAGAGFPVRWEVDKEYPLKVVSADGAWLEVTDEDGLDGWIHKSVTWGYSPAAELEHAAEE